MVRKRCALPFNVASILKGQLTNLKKYIVAYVVLCGIASKRLFPYVLLEWSNKARGP